MFLLLAFVNNQLSSQGITKIVGDTSVCEGSIEKYYLIGEFEDVEWSILGAHSISENDSVVSVVWGNANYGKIVARLRKDSTEETLSRDVLINDKPSAVIIDDIGDLFTQNEDYNLNVIDDDSTIYSIGNDSTELEVTCSPACELGSSNYSSQFNQGVTHFWQASDGNILGSSTDDNVQVNWLANSSPTLSLMVENSQGCTDSVAICISVLEPSKADFKANDACAGGPVNFENLSQNGFKYKWDFGDGTTSEDVNPIHYYATGGEFEVTLYAYNKNNCIDSVTKNITIESNYAPLINCVGPACVGSTVLYSTDADCDNVNWIVEGGTLVAGQKTKTIEVLWDKNVPKGKLELSVSNCQESLCTESTIYYVDLIQSDLPIEGNLKPCNYEESIYSIDAIPGSTYSWEVEGGYIYGSTTTNAVKVEWGYQGEGKLTVYYDNEALQCSGESEITVNIKNKAYLSAPYRVCSGEEFEITTGSNNGEWQVLGAEILSSSSGKANILTGTSKRILVKYHNTDQNYCEATITEELEVTPPVQDLSFISGDSLACLGEEIRYETSAFDLNQFKVVWEFENGTKQSATGNSATVIWDASPKKVNAKLISRVNSSCESNTITKELKEYGDYDVDFTLEGTFCEFTTVNAKSYFNGSPEDYKNLSYEWNISPQEAGSIVNGKYSKETEIRLNGTVQNATITLLVKACGNVIQNVSKPLPILKPQDAEIILPSTYCIGENIEVSSTAHQEIKWELDGNPVSTNFSLNNNASSVLVLKCKDVNECVSSVYKELFPKPLPEKSKMISRTYCPGEIIDVKLFTAYNIDYSYAWFKNGLPIPGESTANLKVTEEGEYSVSVTNQFGCETSNTSNINETTCSGGFTCTNKNGNVSFSHVQNCNSVEFTNTSTANASNLVLYFGDGQFYKFTSVGEKVTHVYDGEVGEYIARLSGEVPGTDEHGDPTSCNVSEQEEILIKILSKYDYEVVSSQNLELKFNDLSSALLDNEITSWNWNFGDLASGVLNQSNNRNPSHVFSSEGTFTVSLTVSNGSCSNTYTKTIEVKRPESSFNVSNQACINTPFDISLSAQASAESIYHEFYINEDTIKNTNPLEYVATSSGMLSIVVMTKNKQGFTSFETKNILVNEPQSTAFINPNTNLEFCEGDSLILTASNSQSYSWSNGANSRSVYAKTNGDYSVSVLDNDGCLQHIAPINVKVNLNPSPVIYSTNAPGFCGNSNSLRVDYLANHSYKWFHEGVDENRNRSSFYTNKEGIFTAQVTNDETGCFGVSEPFNVKKHTIQPISITSSKNEEICNGDTLTLSVNTPEDSVIFTWSHNFSHSKKITVGTSGEYFVTAENAYGCETSATYNVVVSPRPNGEDVISGCFELCDEGYVNLVGLAGYVNNWYKESAGNWQFVGTGRKQFVNESGTYRAIVSNYFNDKCVDTSHVTYVHFEDCAELKLPPDLMINSDTIPLIICLGDELKFDIKKYSDMVYLEFKKESGSSYQEIKYVNELSFQLSPTESGYFRLRDKEPDDDYFSRVIYVEVRDTTNPGKIVTPKINYCEGDSIELFLENPDGTFITWEQKYDTSSTHYYSLNSVQNPLNLVAQENDISIRAKVKYENCPAAYANIDLDVYDIPYPGDISYTGETKLCALDNEIKLVLENYQDSTYNWIAQYRFGQQYNNFTVNGDTLFASDLPQDILFIAKSGNEQCGFTEDRIQFKVSQPVSLETINYNSVYCEQDLIEIKIADYRADTTIWKAIDSPSQFEAFQNSILIEKPKAGDYKFQLQLESEPCVALDTIFEFRVDKKPEINNLRTIRDILCIGDTTTIMADVIGDSLNWYLHQNGTDSLVKTDRGDLSKTSIISNLLSQADTFIVEVFSGICSPLRDTVVIQSKYNFSAGILEGNTNPLTICEGSDILINRRGGNTNDGFWKIEFPDSIVIIQDSILSVELNDVYKNTNVKWVIDKKECGTDSTSLIITPRTKSAIYEFKASEDSLCGPNDIELIAANINGEVDLWRFSKNNGVFQTIDLDNDTIEFYNDVNTRYVLGVKNGDCPAVYDTLQVNVLEEFFYSYDKIICETQDSISFNVYPESNYRLNLINNELDTLLSLNHENNYTIPNYGAGVYYFTILSGPCYQNINDSVVVLSPPKLELDTLLQPSCYGDSNGEIISQVKGMYGLQTKIKWRNENHAIIGSEAMLTNIGAGKYYAELAYSEPPSCASWDSVMLSQPNYIDTLLLNLTDESCENSRDAILETYFTGGTKPYEYSLSVGNITVNSNNINLLQDSGIYVQNLIPGQAILKVEDANKCFREFNFTINEAKALGVELEYIADLKCANQDSGIVILKLENEQENLTVSWPDGVVNNSLARYNLPAVDDYVLVQNENGCTDSVKIEVTAPDSIKITLDSLKNACVGESDAYAKVQVSGANLPVKYNWSNGSSSNFINEVYGGVYQVHIKDHKGCEEEMSITIHEKDKPTAEFEFVQPECGESLLDIKVNASIGDINLFIENDDVDIDYKGNDLFGLSVFEFDEYPIRGEINNEGCISYISDTVVFRVQPKALFAIDESQGLLGFNYIFENQSEDADYYRWTFGGAADTSYKETPGIINLNIRNILNPKVCLDVGTLLGCEANFCLDLNLREVKVEIMIPNTFSPNFDGTNDEFKPVLSGVVPTDYTFEIRNRWGKLMYITNDPNSGWNGTDTNGNKAIIGTYKYILTFTDSNTGKKYTKSGNVLLLL